MSASSSSSSKNHQSQQRRTVDKKGKISVGLESFAQRKGQVRAFEEFKKRKQQKRLDTAKALRKYHKVMKQEGMEAGKGASRKRKVSEQMLADDNVVLEETANPEMEDSNINQSPKRLKSNPLQKSLSKAKQTKEHSIRKAQEREQQEKERQHILKQRKRKSKLLQKRTKRGQPIMKHMVDNLLHKLEKQQEKEQEH